LGGRRASRQSGDPSQCRSAGQKIPQLHLERLNRAAVHPRCALVGLHSLVGLPHLPLGDHKRLVLGRLMVHPAPDGRHGQHWLMVRRNQRPTSWPSTAGCPAPPRLQPWSKSPGADGRWKSAFRPARARSAWTSTRSAAGAPGTASSSRPWSHGRPTNLATGCAGRAAATTSSPRPYLPLPTTGRLATMKITIYGWSVNLPGSWHLTSPATRRRTIPDKQT
jgi:hypothetical protein